MLVEGSRQSDRRASGASPELNTIHRTATLKLQADGSLKGQSRRSALATSPIIAASSTRRAPSRIRHEFLDRVLRQDFTSFSVSDVKVET